MSVLSLAFGHWTDNQLSTAHPLVPQSIPRRLALVLRFIKPDVAAVDAWWEMTGVKGPEGQDIPLRKGLLNFIMTIEDDKWLITIMHNMDLPASL